MPEENKTFIWEDHPMLGFGKHPIEISYYATDELKRASYNSGTDSLILNAGNENSDNNSSIPGFDALLTIIAIISCISLYKRKNDYRG